MYLKSLTLRGFKSFADRTHLAFDPGLNVIVGPNGSGKSNISDAILWVLGEQSAKHLRGQAMEDVVFAGSSARQPVSVAEVDLTLDNGDHVLPIDFSEVSITRRMYRSGESEYLVNGSPARLMDVQDILHDSGLGKETRSIISQGKLDEILMSRPEERRTLIEEAAGISKHKRRRERSLRKIASMDEYLKTAQKLERELARQLRPLERQVEKARAYETLSARAEELSVRLAVDDLRRLQAQWSDVERRGREAGARLDVSQLGLDEASARLEKLRALIEEKGVFVGDLAEQRRRCERIAQDLASLMRLLDEKGRTMVSRYSDVSDAAHRARARQTKAEEELRDVADELVQSRGELNELKRRSQEIGERMGAARAARRDAEGRLADLRATASKAQRERDAAAVALNKVRDALESARVQDGMLQSRADQLAETIDAASADAESAERRLAENESALREARERTAARERDLDACRQASRRARDDEAAASRRLAEARAELEGLRRSVASEENRTPLAGKVAADRAVTDAVVGRVAECLRVPDELAGLVEGVLGDRLRGFVARDDEGLASVAERVVGYGATSGQVTVVNAAAPAAGDEGDGLPGRSLLALLGPQADGTGDHVAAALLGDVRVAQGAREAILASARDPRHLYVSADGVASRAGAVVTLGTPADATHGLLQTQARMRELAASLDGLRVAADDAAEAARAAEARLGEARAAVDEASQTVARLSGETSSLRAEGGRARRALEAAQSELARVTRQRAQIAETTEASARDVERHKAAIAEAEGRMGEANDEAAQVDASLDAIRREDREARDEGGECQIRSARLQEKVRNLDARHNALSRDVRDSQHEAEVSLQTLEALEVMRLRVQPLHELLDALVSETKGRLAVLTDRVSLAESDSSSLRGTMDEARGAVTRAQSEHAAALEEVSAAKVAKGRLEVQVNNAISAITAHRGVVLEEAVKLPAPQDREADERELAQARAQIEALGPVNQVAFQEYARVKERHDYVSVQVADLHEAKAALTKIMAAIDRKMRQGFLDTFAQVNENFATIFAALFPGGSGHLELTDPEHPAETGVEVIAQPRGKRVTKMSLLSGGERSLTALGLLFAVYRTRAVPFYVLDEVEAALDDSNLDRLLDALDVLRASTQLVVISHQRRTMEKADVLYGVSMHADGVSHVVSQRLLHDGQGGVKVVPAR